MLEENARRAHVNADDVSLVGKHAAHGPLLAE